MLIQPIISFTVSGIIAEILIIPNDICVKRTYDMLYKKELCIYTNTTINWVES